ncbi:hypothetical protein N0V86_002666 [Didymella sp. IMI 355093]|nr:hypothetical protein N0V86_002666 [Didymella sp. IMI 355093]
MVPITFYRNAYCEVLLSDVQWYRSTIQGGPYVGNNGAAYYKNNDATLAPGEVSAAGTVAEPPAKRPALLPKEKTPTAHIAGWNDSNSPPTHKKAAPTLLEGPAVKVQVKGILQSKTWYLPQALMSHFSPFIKTTLQNAANASSMLSTQLNGCEPTGFATYVHWMYYGAYDPQHGSRAAYETDSIDAWVLGDRLKVPIFQNLAMSHIYSRYVGSDNHRPLTTSMVQYVCAKTTTNSLLRLLYLDVLTQNFTNQALVKGTLEEWDVALQEHPDARLALLGSFRTQGSRVKSKEEYLVAGVSLDPSRDARSTTAFEPRRLQVNLSALPRIKSEIKKEPEES